MENSAFAIMMENLSKAQSLYAISHFKLTDI
jgi:hypothetical protein